VVRDTWEWLCSEVSRLDGPAADASGVYWIGGRSAITQWMKDYRRGFVAGIDEAYTKMREEVKAETSSEAWGLVAVIDREVLDRYKELFPVTGHRSTAGIGYGDAFGEGRNAGLGTNLSRQVGAGAHNRALRG